MSVEWSRSSCFATILAPSQKPNPDSDAVFLVSQPHTVYVSAWVACTKAFVYDSSLFSLLSSDKDERRPIKGMAIWMIGIGLGWGLDRPQIAH
jgi:hypothetical protein